MSRLCDNTPPLPLPRRDPNAIDIEPVWVPPLLNGFSPSPSPLYPPPVLGPPALYVICPPLPPYNSLSYPSLGCTFPSGCAVFLSNTFSSALLYLWFLSNLIALSCHSPMVVGSSFASASLLLIALFNSLLNSSMRDLLS